jgi:hypothetical protein
MPDSQIKKVACPTCGASLLFGPGEITTRCPFCQAIVERPLQADQPAQVKTDSTKEPWASTTSRPSTVDSSRIFLRVALILTTLIFIGIIAMAVLLITRQASRSGFSLIVNGPVAALATDTPEEPEFISLSYDITGETYLFTRLNPVQKKVVWRGKEFEDISDVRTIVAGDGKFFTVEGTELHAYHAADGAELWQADLSDELGYCGECLSVIGDRAIALTQDYVIQAFDTNTGGPAWKRRMDGYTQGFTIADDGLWVIDKVDSQASLFFLRLDDGTVLKRITPECKAKDGPGGSNLASASSFLLDPDPSVRDSTRSIYLFYGSYPGCVERWDASSATLLWQAEDDKGYSPSKDYAALFTPDRLYFAYRDMLWSAAKTDGQIQVLAEGGDYELVPLAVAQDVLILRTKRTRGTTQFGLRGFDPTAGNILWDYPIAKSAPYDPPDAAFRYVDEDQAIWTWRMSGGLFHMYLFQSNPNQFSTSTLNPKDGTFSAGGTLDFHFSIDSYFGPEILFWKDTTLWFVADSKLMAVDVSTAKLLSQFP